MAAKRWFLAVATSILLALGFLPAVALAEQDSAAKQDGPYVIDEAANGLVGIGYDADSVMATLDTTSTPDAIIEALSSLESVTLTEREAQTIRDSFDWHNQTGISLCVGLEVRYGYDVQDALYELYECPVVTYSSPNGMGYVPEEMPPSNWGRLSGQDRYQTSARVCKSAFETAQTVVITSGEGFSDALAASPLAGLYDAPIMVVPSQGELPLPIAREIARLGASNAIVVGGRSMVSDEMMGQIEAITGSAERIAGKDRIDTSLRILERLGKVNYETAIVVNGSSYADALSIASYAYAAKLPIILTQADGTLRDDAVTAVVQAGCTRVLMVGGKSVVSDSVVSALGVKDTGVGTGDLYSQHNRRIAGANRYDTNAQVLSWEMSTYGVITIGSYINALHPTSARMVYVASGEGYADALSAAAAAGHLRCALALTSGSDQGILPAQTLKEYGPVERGYVVGGGAALSAKAVQAFWDALYA